MIETTFSPTSQDIDALTDGINQAVKELGIEATAYPFGFFMRDDAGSLIAGCNGSVIFGSIYTDQLWVHPDYRGQGYGRQLMEKVHQLGQEKGCDFATVTTTSFQGSRSFYEHLGYVCEFEQSGYANGGTCAFMRKFLTKT